MAYIVPIASVVGFQSQPSSLLVGASVIGLTPVTLQGTNAVSVVGVLQIASVQAFLQSSNASIITTGGTTGNSSVTAYQGGAWSTSITSGYVNVIGSILVAPVGGTPITSLVSTIPSSVQVGASIMGTVPVTQVTSPWVISTNSGSIIATQIANSVMGVRTDAASVIAVVGPTSVQLMSTSASISALVTNQLTGVSSVQLMAGINNAGSITAIQGTNPWVINVPTPSYIAIQAGGSTLQVQIAGSVLTAYQEKNATVASAVGIPFLWKNNFTTSTLSTISINDPLPVQGSVTALQGTNPWVVNMPSGSVIATQIANSVMGVRTDAASVVTVQGIFTKITSVVGTTPSSMLVGASVMGNLGAYQIGVWGASVLLTPGVNPIGSVATLQGTNPWIVNVPTPSYLSIQPGGSVLNANISGSVATAVTVFSASVAANINVISASVMVNQGTNPWVIGSIVGTFAEDAAHTTADKGIFSLNVRNDTMSSVTSTDGDYGALSVGPVGEGIVANSPITKWVSTVTSVMNGVSVQVLAGPGTSIFTYITGINIINEASVASRVTITQGLGRVASSFLTVLIAPAGGGSNNSYINPIRVLDNNGISASINAVASIYVTITGFTAKT